MTGLPRKLVRRVRSVLNYYARIVPAIRQAHSLHCNGYPIYEATVGYNSNRLLYLDSRMSQDSLIRMPSCGNGWQLWPKTSSIVVLRSIRTHEGGTRCS